MVILEWQLAQILVIVIVILLVIAGLSVASPAAVQPSGFNSWRLMPAARSL